MTNKISQRLEKFFVRKMAVYKVFICFKISSMIVKWNKQVYVYD